MLAQRKTHGLILICLWAAFSGVLTPFLGPWGAVIAGAGATQLAYRIAKPLLADAKSLWATGMIFTWVGAIALTVHDWRTVGAGTGIVESLCLAVVAAAGTVWLVRKAKPGVAAFQAEFKASSLKAAEITERAAAERAERRAGRPDGFDGLGLRRSARLGSLTTTLLDHARKTVAEGRPAEGAVADVRAKLAKDPGLLPLLHYNVGRAEVDDTVRAAAAALLAEVAGLPPQPPVEPASVAPAPAPRAAGWWAVAGGVAAGPLFLAGGLAQGLARDGFDFTRNAISQLALGEAGWIQTASFVLTGALLIACAAGLRHTLRGGPGGTSGPALVGVFGVSFWLAAAFPADPGAGFPAGAPEATVMSGHGAVHMFGGMAGYLALCAAFLVLARPLAARGLRGWAAASRVVPVAVLAGFMASAASVLAFTVGAGLGLLWLSAVTARLAGAPAGR